MQGISATILELTRAQLVDPAREGELAELLESRDPVQLVTSRSLFRAIPLALVSLEAPELSERVFAGSRWLDARGSSIVLEEFARGAGPASLAGVLAATGLPAGSVVTARPGGALVLVDQARGQAAAGALASAFTSTTGMEARVAVEELWPDEALLGRSPDLVRPPRYGVLADALGVRAAAAGGTSGAGLASLPGFVARCHACRLAPAAHQSEADPRHGVEPLCDRCHARREAARASVDAIVPHLEQAVELTETERERHDEQTGQIALVAGLGGVDQVGLTHNALHAALDGAVSELVEKLGLRRRWQRHASGPAELAILLPAARALDGVRRLIEGVEAGLAREAEGLSGYPEIQEGLRRMRLSVGICFAPVSYGPSLVGRLARALAASARRLARQRPADAPPASTVDFWVLADGNPHGFAVDELRHHVYESRRDVRLTRRPYAYPDFKREVLDGLRPFRRLPRPEVAELKRQLALDPRSADLNLRYQVARSEQWRQYAGEVAGKDPARWDGLLFRTTADGARDTGFLDLAELAEFHD